LIRDTGSTDWTVRTLCRQLECAPGAIYRYFPGGVEAIGAEIRGRHVAELSNLLDGVEEDTTAEGLPSLGPTSWAARLTRRCAAYIRFAGQQPEIYRSLFALRETDETVGRAELADETLLRRPAEIIQKAAEGRELNRPSIGRFDAERSALIIWSRLHGFADLSLSGLVGDRLDEMGDRLLIDILAVAGFKVAAYPAGLEAAAKAARRNG
jgi:AcrR family transcriptional regulator